MSQATITALAQRELRDVALPFQATAIGDGATKKFELPVANIQSGYTVTLDGSPLTVTTDFTIDLTNGIITLDSAPTTGQELLVEGTYQATFPDVDWDSFVATAFTQHVHGRDPQIVMDNPVGNQETLPLVEEYLVAILASIQALYVLATRASMDIDVHHPDGVIIPRSQRFQQIMAMIDARERQYAKLAESLNVGLNRIQMFTLRRVSRATNRLVPVYQPMEYDQINRGFSPTEGPEGTIVVIKGRRFVNVTDVKFGGVSVDPDEIVVVDDTEIVVTVPVGAITGVLTVVTAGGSVSTGHAFTVRDPVPEIWAGGPIRVRPPIDPQV